MDSDTKETVIFGLTGLVVACVLYCITIIPMHELGHAAVCMYEEYDPVLTFDGRLGIRCEGIEPPFWPYHMMGGTFGAAAALTLYVLGRVVRAPVLMLASIPMAVSQTVKAVMETAFHVEYMSDPLTPLLAVVPAVYVGYMLVAHRRSRAGRNLLNIE